MIICPPARYAYRARPAPSLLPFKQVNCSPMNTHANTAIWNSMELLIILYSLAERAHKVRYHYKLKIPVTSVITDAITMMIVAMMAKYFWKALLAYSFINPLLLVKLIRK